MTDEVLAAAKAIRAADALLITAGAGMGVDSGLPDFRGPQGFWRAYPAMAQRGLSFAEMASPRWFQEDPELAWAFYGHRLNLYRQTTPHAGFGILLGWARARALGYFVFTSNVDGHFQKAGFAEDRISECHGSIHYWQCVDGCSRSIWAAAGEEVSVEETVFRARAPLPRCRRCGGLARPNILLFGDGQWLSERSDAQQQRFTRWLGGLEQRSARLAVIELGAGTAIPTVRHVSESAARRLGGRLVRINPREADVPAGHFGLATTALEGLRLLALAAG